MFRGAQIAYTDKKQCLCEINVAPLVFLLIHVDGMVCANLTARHIHILAGMAVAEDNSSLQLGLLYQNISLRQSI